MLPSAVKIGDRFFYLDGPTAERVQLLLAEAANSSQSLVPDGGRVSATLLMMDELKMKTVVVDGKDLAVSDDIARVIESLQGQNAALASVVRGGGQQMRDAAGDAMRQEGIRARDPATPYGAYVRKLNDAWKTPADV